MSSTKHMQTHIRLYYIYLLATMTVHFSSTQNLSFGESAAFWHLNTQSHSLLPHLGNCALTFTAYNSGSGRVGIWIFNLKRWCESDTSISVLERIPTDLWARLCEFLDLQDKYFTCTYLAESVAFLTGLKFIYTLFTHFFDDTFRLLVVCIFHDIYFCCITYFSSWGEEQSPYFSVCTI